MPLQHYLPATYLANFSSDTTFPRRGRRIAVGDKRTGKIFTTSIANVAAENNLYTLTGGAADPLMVDKIWGDYESGIADAIEGTLKPSLDAITWARVLVPFVTCLFVRGPEFGLRFDARLRSIGFVSDSDNTNLARMMELQRLLAPILTAKWLVLRAHGDGDIIVNDLGFAGFISPRAAESGLSVPLDRSHVLMIIPQRDRTVAQASGDSWYATLEHDDLTPGNHLLLNKTLDRVAQRFIFGPNEEVVKSYITRSDTSEQVPDLVELGFLGEPLARVHEFTWYRLVSVLENHPLSSKSWDIDLDWDALAAGWVPTPLLPMNTPMYPSAVRRKKGLLRVSLYDLSDIEDFK